MSTNMNNLKKKIASNNNNINVAARNLWNY